MLLEGKAAIISGVGPNLGREVALQFARQGASLVLGARTVEKSAKIAEEVATLGAPVEVTHLDISSPESCAQVVELCRSRFGRVDVLVNNAYREGRRAPFMEADLHDWVATMETNLWGTLQMTRAVVPVMAEQNSGQIVMVNSIMARRMFEGYGSYSISKAALATATKMLAMELGRFGIRVNGIHSGPIAGDTVEANFDGLAAEGGVSAEKIRRRMVSETSLKYLPDAAEVAGTIVFLASELSRPITGQSIPVDAGTRL